MAGWVVYIVRYEDEGIEHQLRPYQSERQADRADDGVNRNLDHERFYTRIAEVTP